MYNLGELHPKFRVKVLGRDELSRWDGEWFYHFREGPYREIEWVEIAVTSDAQREAVRGQLRVVHVPGFETPEGFRVMGWVPTGTTVDYI